MTELLKELEAVVEVMRKGSPRQAIAAFDFLSTHHAEIAEAVRDAGRWKGVEAVMAMTADKVEGQITSSCGLLLIDYAARNNAGTVELRFGGVTNAETGELGDWTIRIEKAIDVLHNSAREVGE